MPSEEKRERSMFRVYLTVSSRAEVSGNDFQGVPTEQGKGQRRRQVEERKGRVLAGPAVREGNGQAEPLGERRASGWWECGMSRCRSRRGEKREKTWRQSPLPRAWFAPSLKGL